MLLRRLLQHKLTYATLSSLKLETKKAVVAKTQMLLESARGLKVSQAKQVVQKEVMHHSPFLPFVPMGVTKSLSDAAVKTKSIRNCFKLDCKVDRAEVHLQRHDEHS
jgi:hypothetical protein